MHSILIFLLYQAHEKTPKILIFYLCRLTFSLCMLIVISFFFDKIVIRHLDVNINEYATAIKTDKTASLNLFFFSTRHYYYHPSAIVFIYIHHRRHYHYPDISKYSRNFFSFHFYLLFFVCSNHSIIIKIIIVIRHHHSIL